MRIAPGCVLFELEEASFELPLLGGNRSQIANEGNLELVRTRGTCGLPCGLPGVSMTQLPSLSVNCSCLYGRLLLRVFGRSGNPSARTWAADQRAPRPPTPARWPTGIRGNGNNGNAGRDLPVCVL